MSGALPILQVSGEDLAALVAARVEGVLTSARIEEMAAQVIEGRVALKTLEEAQKIFRCPTRQALLEFCRAQRIPVARFSQKKQFILVSEIEKVTARKSCVPGEGEEGAGTRTVIAGRFAAKEDGGVDSGNLMVDGQSRERAVNAGGAR